MSAFIVKNEHEPHRYDLLCTDCGFAYTNTTFEIAEQQRSLHYRYEHHLIICARCAKPTQDRDNYCELCWAWKTARSHLLLWFRFQQIQRHLLHHLFHGNGRWVKTSAHLYFCSLKECQNVERSLEKTKEAWHTQQTYSSTK